MSVPVLFGVSGPTVEAIEIGWEDNGYVTGLLGIVLLLIGILRKGTEGHRYSILATLLAGLALLQVAGCFQRVLEINPEAGFFPATKVGIYITLLGASLAMTGALTRPPITSNKGDSAYVAHASQI
jgi:hypothetical protein